MDYETALAEARQMVNQPLGELAPNVLEGRYMGARTRGPAHRVN